MKKVMEKSKTTIDAQVNETLTNDANQENVNETLTVEIPEFMLPILEQRKNEDEENVKILANLNAELKNAKKEYVNELTIADFEQTEKTILAAANVKKADDAIIDFNKKLTLLELERESNDSLNIARYDIADKFNISLELLDKLVADSKDVKNTLKSSFTALFGRPVIHAKTGQTGKDLTKSSQPKNDTPNVNASLNGNPEKVGSKRYEIFNDLVNGITYVELLAKYPTDGNAEKLNGTARTVISDHKFKRQADDTYTIVAE